MNEISDFIAKAETILKGVSPLTDLDRLQTWLAEVAN